MVRKRKHHKIKKYVHPFFFKYNKMFQLVAEEGAEERAKVRLPEKAKNLFGKLIQIGMKLPFLSFKQGKTDFE